MKISKQQASVIGWATGFLTLCVLLTQRPDFASESPNLLIAILILTAFMLNVGLTFSAGEISAAHTVGMIAYLLLSPPANALWLISIGAVIGVLIREARDYKEDNWLLFFLIVWRSIARRVGQLVLSLVVAGWFYSQLDGQRPLERFASEDLLPVSGFVVSYLAVYLALLVIQIRSQQRRHFRRTILLNLQSMIGMLVVPIPIAILTAVSYSTISNLAFGLLSINLALMVVGIYGLSRTQFLYQQQVRDLSTLAIISDALRTSLTVDSLLRTLYLQVATLMDVQNFTVAFYDPTEESIRFPIHVRDGQPVELPPVPHEAGIQKDARQVAAEVIAQAAELNIIPPQFPTSAWMGTPIQTVDQTIGVIIIAGNTPEREFEQQDRQLLSTIAAQTALAISNAQLYSSKDAALTRRIEQLSILETLGQELFSSRIHLTGIYEQVLKRAAEGTSAHAGILVLKENENQPARPVAMFGFAPETETQVEVLVTLTRQVMQNAFTTLTNDFRKDRSFPALRPQTRSILSVPIMHHQTVIGALTLESNLPNAFGNEDLIFVMQVGSQIRIAIDNANLFRSIESTRDRLQTILDSMTEAILLIDTDGYIRLANPRVESLLNLKPQRLMNESVIQLLQDSSLSLAANLGFESHTLRGMCAGLHSEDWEPDGQRSSYAHIVNAQSRYLERTDVAVRDQKNAVIGWLMVFVDITEERELTQAREDLYNMIVHDLRGPLTAIQASMKLVSNITVSDPALRPVVEQTTETAGRAVRKLLNLVNSLLDIAKMESGTITLEAELTDAAQLVASVVQELKPLALEMEVQLIPDVPAKLPRLDIDSEKIGRVLWNLVDNAVKFAPSGGKVWIRAQVEPSTGDSEWMKIQVVDNGPGIPDAHKQRLFDRYVQLEGQAGQRRGTGLGLTFCRLAVEAHQGRIWIEDNPQGGSVFCFTLPIFKQDK